ncbi:S1C family serine protease [Marinibaculum pumilum]|uniref:S1C family serine protease n=1 Tax=Marinibaculum pumilum TaxID=1766165 RepID=A0ABV7L2S3_9PROT
MRSRAWRYLAIWALLVATLWVGDRFVRGVWLTADEPRVVTPRGQLSDVEEHTIALFRHVSPSVVAITAAGARPGGRGAGSGFVWDGAGHVVTNAHVVEGAAQVWVRFGDAEVVGATVIGVAQDHDLAVVLLDDNRLDLRPIPVGSTDELQVGQSVYAIGNPFGLPRSLTTGIISALDREILTGTGREVTGVIQTDAAINPGNSGGPLIDSAGRLIGVNTAIVSGSGSFSGVGFAVPVDEVNRIVPALIRDGRVARPGIGIAVASPGRDLPPGLRAGTDQAGGIVVAQVFPDTPAARAGLEGIAERGGALADIITAVDGREVHSLAELARELARAGVGARVELTVVRDGSSRAVPVEVIDIGRS